MPVLKRSIAASEEARPRERAIPRVSAEKAMPEVAYWLFNFTPKWEAVSEEVELLANSLDHRFNTRIMSLGWRYDSIRLRGRDKNLPLPFGILGLPFLAHATRAAAINHVFGSPSVPLFTQFLPAENTILTVAKNTPSLEQLEKHTDILKSLRSVVVESERDKDLMLQIGLAPDRVRIIYPGVNVEATRIPDGPFTILFATSPFHKYGLLTRGVHLMIETAKLLPDVRFRLVWRSGAERVHALIREAGVDNVEVIEGFVPDMRKMYHAAHATILPALAYNSLKPCPHSGLHSLAHGKPLLVSQAVSLSEIVDETQCGVVFEPTISSLCSAIDQLRDHYTHYQSNALSTSRNAFSKRRFVEQYASLYDDLLNHGS